MIEPGEPVVRLDRVTHRYGKTVALDDVTLALPAQALIGLIGPDGVGKSTLLGIVAGARRIQVGAVTVLGARMAHSRQRAALRPRIAYMPQGLGTNLYPDLSVRENIEFFGRLFGYARAARDARIRQLMAATGLAPFAGRPAKKLSGGMRQKLGLCCALIHDPDLLILDEPTTGVDPLSRRQFWDLIARMRLRRPNMTVLVATAYMEEAERFDWLVVMDAGRTVAAGSPAALRAHTGSASIEEAFVALSARPRGPATVARRPPPSLEAGSQPVIAAAGLTRRFGDFVAVDNVSFEIARGEIFGFVGSNGCGKTTTMKMLTGLLAPSEGRLRLFGRPIDPRNLETRRRVGYMSQSFSLYSELTARQNLALHARLFRLSPSEADSRIAELVERFGLADHLDQPTISLPLGIRQRLSLAVAVVHRPELLVLDEPTSGVDPVARDIFWELLADLSRSYGVTIFVSTHFMNEAERCDRLSLMDAGRVLATDTPAELVAAAGAASLEDAFVWYLQRASAPTAAPSGELLAAEPDKRHDRAPSYLGLRLQRLFAYTIRETLELVRDPIRLAFALFGTAFLMLVLGYGISTDVNNLAFAALDHDQSHESRAYLEELRGSSYFSERTPLADYADLDRRLRDGEIAAAIEIPPRFGRDMARGRPVSVAAWIDGARPFIAQTIRGYLQGMHQLYLTDPAVHAAPVPPAAAADVIVRFKYNQNFESKYAMVPATLAMELALFPAILMALAIVREKEFGSITNLYVTPVTRLEFLVGKQLPYIAVALVNFALMVSIALLVFAVPFKGSFVTLAVAAAVYVTVTTAYGMLISAFTRSQIAALFGTAILTVLPATQFAGMLVPVSALTGVAQLMGRAFPMTYFLPISVGTFTKGLGFGDLKADLAALVLFIPALTGASLLLLRKQGR